MKKGFYLIVFHSHFISAEDILSLLDKLRMNGFDVHAIPHLDRNALPLYILNSENQENIEELNIITEEVDKRTTTNES